MGIATIYVYNVSFVCIVPSLKDRHFAAGANPNSRQTENTTYLYRIDSLQKPTLALRGMNNDGIQMITHGVDTPGDFSD